MDNPGFQHPFHLGCTETIHTLFPHKDNGDAFPLKTPEFLPADFALFHVILAVGDAHAARQDLAVWQTPRYLMVNICTSLGPYEFSWSDITSAGPEKRRIFTASALTGITGRSEK
jgi:hypothetical protein